MGTFEVVSSARESSTTVSRPLEWTVTPSQGQNVQIFLDILQEVVDSEPVNEQHTWITVLANCSCVQLGRLSSREESFSLAIQESPREDLARMVYNAPLPRAERWLRSIAKCSLDFVHFVAMWVCLTAARSAFARAHGSGNPAADALSASFFYGGSAVLAVALQYAELLLFPRWEHGQERLASNYHDKEYARGWIASSSTRARPLRRRAAADWKCRETDVVARQLHLRTSFAAVRAIKNALREKGRRRMETALLSLNMQLPLLPHLTDPMQEEQQLKLRVVVSHEVRPGLFSRPTQLAQSAFEASGTVSWKRGIQLDVPVVEELLDQPPGRAALPPGSPGSQLQQLENMAGTGSA